MRDERCFGGDRCEGWPFAAYDGSGRFVVLTPLYRGADPTAGSGDGDLVGLVTDRGERAERIERGRYRLVGADDTLVSRDPSAV